MILQTVIVIILMKVQNQTGETNICMYLMKYHPRTTKTQVFSLAVLNFYCAFMEKSLRLSLSDQAIEGCAP